MAAIQLSFVAEAQARSSRAADTKAGVDVRLERTRAISPTRRRDQQGLPAAARLVLLV